MASNRFGRYFTVTTWGESHGPAIGCVIDGCPAGVAISEEEITAALAQRAPGTSPYVSPRKEQDIVQILSGVFEGKTTSTPILLLITNTGHDSSKYEPLKELLRPGHANFTYLQKYGVFDWRGGGRASARETAARVAAGAIAQKILEERGMRIASYVKSIGSITAEIPANFDELRSALHASTLFCPNSRQEEAMKALIEQLQAEGDSIGGVVECQAIGVPPGLGEPIYEKIEAHLAYAMMSIPASKAFEIGSGVAAGSMKGSEHNDPFYTEEGTIKTKTNHAGGVLAGITTGMPLVFRTHFKPASSIKKRQTTRDLQGNEQEYVLPEGSKHDPTVVIRAVPVVQAMCALVLVDACMTNNFFTSSFPLSMNKR